MIGRGETFLFDHRSISRVIGLLAFIFLILSAGCQGNSAPQFQGERAYSDLVRQVSFGPRVPNTVSHEECRKFLVSQLKESTPSVQEQKFRSVVDGKTLQMSNILAQFNPKAAKQILLLAHWDTRPIADQELDKSKRNQPIPGADDGASGVAVLLELSRLFKKEFPKIGVTLLLVDGEDYGRTEEDMLLGTRYFADHLKGMKYEAAILLDMIGDKDLQIYREENSDNSAHSLNDRIWKASADLGYQKYFPDQVKYSIIDDHIPLQQVGIPAVDVIDFDYAYWHTLQDTSDKCSAQSLQIVGNVITKVVYEYK